MNDLRFEPLQHAWQAFLITLTTTHPLCEACQQASALELAAKVKPRDWEAIIAQLEVHLDIRVIGRLVGKTPQAVRGWKEGCEPKDSDARRLMALHAKYCRHP